MKYFYNENRYEFRNSTIILLYLLFYLVDQLLPFSSSKMAAATAEAMLPTPAEICAMDVGSEEFIRPDGTAGADETTASKEAKGSNKTTSSDRTAGFKNAAAGDAGTPAAFKRESRLRSLSGTVDMDYTADAAFMSPLIGYDDGGSALPESDFSRVLIGYRHGSDSSQATPFVCKSRLLAKLNNVRYQSGECPLECCAQGGIKRRYSAPLPSPSTGVTSSAVDKQTEDEPMTFDRLPPNCKSKVITSLIC